MRKNINQACFACGIGYSNLHIVSGEWALIFRLAK